MTRRQRRQARGRQASLFDPPHLLPKWCDLRPELRTTVLELIAQMLRDKRRRMHATQEETTDE